MATKEEFLQGTSKPLTARWLWERLDEEVELRRRVVRTFEHPSSGANGDDSAWWGFSLELYRRATDENPEILKESTALEFHTLLAWISGGVMMGRKALGLGDWGT